MITYLIDLCVQLDSVFKDKVREKMKAKVDENHIFSYFFDLYYLLD